jgi:hypothetical protein
MNNSKKVQVEDFKSNSKRIIFFGSIHSKSNQQIEKIEKSLFKLNPEVILIEGNYNKADFNSKQESIEKGLEMGFVSFLAKEKQIKLESNDPPFSQDLAFVKEKYGEEVCFAYFFLRNKNFNIPKEHILKEIKENTSWENFDYSIKNLKKIIKEILNEEHKAKKDYSDYFDPTKKINLFNKISFELSDFRDEYMIKKIKETLKKHNKIFIIKGVYHLNKIKNE